MKASPRLAENDIITRGVTVKIQRVAVRKLTTLFYMYTHFYFVDIFPTEHVLFVKRVLIGCSYH
jgi:hypothetical protein